MKARKQKNPFDLPFASALASRSPCIWARVATIIATLPSKLPIVVKRETWICADAFIGLGAYSMVGAIMIGNRARLLRWRSKRGGTQLTKRTVVCDKNVNETAPSAGPNAHAGAIPITVVVPVRNEERNLPRCLAALSRFTEVMVVDSGSTDGTQEIARHAGARLVDFRWDGRYPKKRNWVLLNQKLANDWVLFLDADEVVDARFCGEVAAAVASGRCDGHWLTYTNHFLGRRLRHGVPQRKLALMRVGRGLYERIDEERWSDLDMEVHEHPVIDGHVGEIRAPIEHNDRSGLAVFLDRHRSYALWEARRLQRIEDGDGKLKLTRRQRIKYANLARWWFPWSYFLYDYVVRLGFLDGRAGFSYAFYKLWYFETVRQLIHETRRERVSRAQRRRGLERVPG